MKIDVIWCMCCIILKYFLYKPFTLFFFNLTEVMVSFEKKNYLPRGSKNAEHVEMRTMLLHVLVSVFFNLKKR